MLSSSAETSLAQIDRARDLTRGQLARILQKDRQMIMQLEEHCEILLSTLRSYVEAMGGSMSFAFQFGEHPPLCLGSLVDKDLVAAPAAGTAAGKVSPAPKTASETTDSPILVPAAAYAPDLANAPIAPAARSEASPTPSDAADGTGSYSEGIFLKVEQTKSTEMYFGFKAGSPGAGDDSPKTAPAAAPVSFGMSQFLDHDKLFAPLSDGTWRDKKAGDFANLLDRFVAAEAVVARPVEPVKDSPTGRIIEAEALPRAEAVFVGDAPANDTADESADSDAFEAALKLEPGSTLMVNGQIGADIEFGIAQLLDDELSGDWHAQTDDVPLGADSVPEAPADAVQKAAAAPVDTLAAPAKTTAAPLSTQDFARHVFGTLDRSPPAAREPDTRVELETGEDVPVRKAFGDMSGIHPERVLPAAGMDRQKPRRDAGPKGRRSRF